MTISCAYTSCLFPSLFFSLCCYSLPPFFFSFLFCLPSITPKIVDLLEDLLNHHSATNASRSNALTALAKVSYRLGGGLGEEGKSRVEGMLESYRSSITLELQQR